MNKKDRLAYDRHIDAIMVQNDVLDTAKQEGFAEGHEKGHEKGMAEGRAKGMAEGRAEGRAEGIMDTAKRMKAHGMEPTVIAVMTGLSIEDINVL